MTTRRNPTTEVKMFVPAKSIFSSKTFWVAAIEITYGVLEIVSIEVLGDGAGWMAVALGSLKLILRYVTKQPVTIRGKGGKSVEADTV